MVAVPREAFLELFLNGWTPVTALQRSPITITRGRLDWAGDVSPSRFHAELDNASGDLNPDNPKGQYYGLLGQNTRMRYGYVILRDTYGRTVVDGFGSTTPDSVQGHVTRSTAYTLDGTAADFDVGSGVGTIVIAAASTVRHAYLAGLIALQDYELTVDVTVPSGTGGDCSGGHIFRGTTTSDFWRLSLTVTTGGAVNLNIADSAGGLRGSVYSVGSGGGTYRVQALVEANTIYGKAWPVADVEPYKWQVSYTVPKEVVLNAAGWPGLRARTDTAATNATFTYDNYTIRLIRFFGVAADITPESDSTGNEKWTTIEGASTLKRLERNTSPARSAPRVYIPTTLAKYYWPLEGGTLSTAAQPAVGNSVMTLTATQSPAVHFGKGGLGAILHPGVAMLGGNDRLTASVDLSASFADEWTVDHIRAGGAENTSRLEVTNAAGVWAVNFLGATKSVEIVRAVDGSVGVTSYPLLFDGEPHHVRFAVLQSGADVDVFLNVDSVVATSGSGQSAYTLTRATKVSIVDQGPVAHSDPLAVAHVVVYTEGRPLINFHLPVLGHVGETAGSRLQRLCSENGIPLSYIGDLAATAKMGPQRAVPLLELLQECAHADYATLVESRMADGLLFITGASLYNRPAGATLDYSLGQLADSFSPKRDDQRIRNKVTARRVDGGTYTATQNTGPLNVNDPGDDPAGVGVYDAAITPDVNVQTDLQLPDIAGWETHLGTSPTPRFPSITVNCSSQNITTALDDALLTLDVDDRIVVQNLSSLDRYDPVSQLVRGYTETLDTIFMNRLEFTCAPESSYHVLELEHADYGRLDTEGSVLAAAIDASATALSVATTSGPLWTTDAGQFPFAWKIGGEKVTVTDIDNEVITFIAAGTAAHADNANVTPGLPAGIAAGNVLLILAAIRSTSGTPNIPAGYTLLWDVDPGPTVAWSNVRLFGKIAASSESAPSVSFFNGAAGDTTSAQMAAFGGKWYSLANTEVVMPARCGFLNSSAQDIAHPALHMDSLWANSLILRIGWKQDDWTSVTSPGTEIGEPSSTLGNDQGLVWSYEIQTTATDIAAGSFTVTGGAAAISKAGVLALRCDRQAATVTRNVNSLPGGKSHAIGAKVQLADPIVLGLTGG